MPTVASSTLLAGAAIALLGFLAGNAFAVWMLLRLPSDYFARPDGDEPSRTKTTSRVRTALGIVLVAAGLVLSLPGVFGPGLLVVLAGITLIESRSRRVWERRLIRAPGLLGAANRIRARFGRAPLVLPSTDEPK